LANSHFYFLFERATSTLTITHDDSFAPEPIKMSYVSKTHDLLSIKNKVKNLVISDGCSEVEDFAFVVRFQSIESIFLAESVKKIGSSPFSSPVLKHVTLLGNVDSIDSLAFFVSTNASISIDYRGTTVPTCHSSNTRFIASVTVPSDYPSYLFCGFYLISARPLGNSNFFYELDEQTGLLSITHPEKLNGVTIPDEPLLMEYFAETPYLLENEDLIKHVVIKKGCNRVDDLTFTDFRYIESFSLASSVNSLGELAFLAPYLTELTIYGDISKIDYDALYSANKSLAITYYGSQEPDCDASNTKFISLVKVPSTYPSSTFCGFPVSIISSRKRLGESNFYYEFEDTNNTLIITHEGEDPEDLTKEITKLIDSLKFDVKHIFISNGCKSIGNYAFALFRNIISVSLSADIKQVGELAFISPYLTSATIYGDDITLKDDVFYTNEHSLNIIYHGKTDPTSCDPSNTQYISSVTITSSEYTSQMFCGFSLLASSSVSSA